MNKLYASLVALVALVMLSPVSAFADTWGEPINTPDRFIVLSSFNGEAVRDTETGLVWEQSPDTTTRTWINAQICNIRTVGNRKGWRLPTIQELASLVDPTQANPALPPGHQTIFSNVQSSFYWSATTKADNTSLAWGLNFSGGDVFEQNKVSLFFAWCVRGGQGVDPQ